MAVWHESSWLVLELQHNGKSSNMKPLVSDALWQRVQPLLPPQPKRRFRFPGRKPLDYRKILTGILFVLKTGIAWDDLPSDLGCGWAIPFLPNRHSGSKPAVRGTCLAVHSSHDTEGTR